MMSRMRVVLSARHVNPLAFSHNNQDSKQNKKIGTCLKALVMGIWGSGIMLTRSALL